MNAAEIIARSLKSGDESLFAELVDTYKERVHRLVVSILGPGFDADAEDVAQEVFIQVYRSLPSFRRDSTFSTWLYSITRRKAIDRKRRARFRMPHVDERALETAADVAAGAHRIQPTGTGGAIDEFEQRDLVAAVLAALPQRYRTVVHLRYWMGCSVNEIAELSGMRPGTVKSHLHRARALLLAGLRRKGVHDVS